ncbi:MAG: riboflavin kinase [Phycisphaerales bacterium]
MARSVISIGSFDGVHVGHAALIARARAIARERAAAHPGTRVLALAFDPHPLSVLLGVASAPARLTSFDERRRLLLACGADDVLRLEPTPDRLGQSAEAFIEQLAAEHQPIAIVEGEDFRFGRARSGDPAVLASLGSRLGFETVIVPAVEVALSDHSVVKASSTLCRWLLAHGRVDDAARLLGNPPRPFRLAGEVVPGDRRGRSIGFPTANIRTELMLPADGVYAALARLPDGRNFPAAINIGERPTFAGLARTLEAHVILSAAPLTHPAGSPAAWTPIPGLPEYGWTIELDLLAWLRDQHRFAGIDALRAQLVRDCARAATIAHLHPDPPNVLHPSTPSNGRAEPSLHAHTHGAPA